MRVSLTLVASLLLLSTGCAMAHSRAMASEAMPAAPLTENYFRRDNAGSLAEENLQKVLAAPVFISPGERLGVVPVATAYQPEGELPLSPVPPEITKALESSGLFEATTEVSTDFPADAGISGLRELAARYRSGYLLLYRQRFQERSRPNGWAWLYPTIIGVFFAPAETLTTDAVIEATLFDVRTGTLLFTAYERVHASAADTVFNSETRRTELRQKLLAQAASSLASQVVSKARRLADVPAAKAAAAAAPDRS